MTDPKPYFERAAKAAQSAFMQGRALQFALIEREVSTWGAMVLRRIADRATNAARFELLVVPNDVDPAGPFPIAADVVGAAISEGRSALLASLASSPEALAEVARRSPAVNAILLSLEVAQATCAQTPTSTPRTPRL